MAFGVLGVFASASALVGAALLSFLLTPAFAKLARHLGLVARPSEARWHLKTTPLLGGVAMTIGIIVVLGLTLPAGPTSAVLVLCVGASCALGLLDDVRNIAPSSKLVGQVMIASLLVLGGIQVQIVPSAPVAFLVTVIWVVAMMNAVNLTDNMDGLAAGICAIAGVALAITALPNLTAAIVAATAAGASLGFLVHNFYPAKVFMGDAGSMVLGFLLATAAILHSAQGSANLGISVLGPLVVLAIPIFDTALVSFSRRLAGRPVSKGGRDHVSHRLVALGLSDRATVVLLYLVSAGLAVLVIGAEVVAGFFLPLILLAVIGLVLFGVFLSQTDPYPDRRIARPRTPRAEATFRVGRFGAEVLLDVTLLTLAYYVAHLVRFEGHPQSDWMYEFASTLPWLIIGQLGALTVFGVYRTLWRYLDVPDAASVLRALAIGTVGAAVLLEVVGPPAHSQAVFIADWLTASVLLLAARAFLIWLRRAFAVRTPGTRSVVIVGASDPGELALRLLRQAGASFQVIGFLDDDPGKRYRRIAGVPVVGRVSELGAIAGRLHVDLVVASGPETVDEVEDVCRTLGIECQVFSVPALATAGDLPIRDGGMIRFAARPSRQAQ
jgi:UDP-GlcNAc:undecaprenyl-phosphate GlcNAc-1-phosphate transferase